jgi:hypothetical protein
MPTLQDLAEAYEAATDGCRCLVRGMQNNARQEQRVKPDPETHPEAEFDYEGGVLRFSRFDLISLLPLRNEECPGIELLDEAPVAKVV